MMVRSRLSFPAVSGRGLPATLVPTPVSSVRASLERCPWLLGEPICNCWSRKGSETLAVSFCTETTGQNSTWLVSGPHSTHWKSCISYLKKLRYPSNTTLSPSLVTNLPTVKKILQIDCFQSSLLLKHNELFVKSFHQEVFWNVTSFWGISVLCWWGALAKFLG